MTYQVKAHDTVLLEASDLYVAKAAYSVAMAAYRAINMRAMVEVWSTEDYEWIVRGWSC